MKIAVGSDHAGFRLKQEVLSWLSELGHEASDFGTMSGDSVDYPDFALMVCEAVAGRKADFGILVCGTGLGMAIGANKVPGIRAVTCSDSFSARCSREHNDANVLCLGERVIGSGVARDIVETWLAASFQGGRHTRRVDKISGIERKYTSQPSGGTRDA
ncbi:MAG: ribose 5-phosphate isomerase B [Bacillota bacterium]